jgi:hypothetical protein
MGDVPYTYQKSIAKRNASQEHQGAGPPEGVGCGSILSWIYQRHDDDNAQKTYARENQ